MQEAPTPLRVVLVDNFAPQTVATIANNLAPGWRCTCLPPPGDPERGRVLSDADLLFVTGFPIDRTLLDSAPSVRVVHKLGAGIDRVDLDACREKRIAVFRLGAANAHVVAEHTIMLMLATLRHLNVLDRATRNGAWLKEAARASSHQLAGKCVGLVGLGAVGRAVARRLMGFDVELVYYDVDRGAAQVEDDLGCRWLALDDLCAVADVVSLHVPLTAETRLLFDEPRIRRMKPGAYLINTARGGLVNPDALRAALTEGRLAGAGLDTFEVEPPADSALLSLDEVVVTPHMAGVSTENVGNLVRRACQNVHDFLEDGEVPVSDVVYDPR